jgi:acetyltransferase
MALTMAPTTVEHWTLADGTAVTMRPIGPEDAKLEQEFVRGLSHESKYFRFFAEVSELSPEMLERFTHPDPAKECALIVTVARGDEEEEIAVARYARNPDKESGEFAVVVADAWHDRGIAWHLMQELMRHAARSGLKRMEGFILSENRRMLNFVRALGFDIRPSVKGPAIKIASRTLDDLA